MTLYAQWSINSYNVMYDGNGHTGGTVPQAETDVTYGEEVTVLGNLGNLTRTGYTFTGWNTKANGSGTVYADGDTLTVGDADVTLYAQWQAVSTSAPADDGPEIIRAPVTGDGDSGKSVAAGTIYRTAATDGTYRDRVEFTPQQAVQTVNQLKDSGSSTAVLYLPDETDRVSEMSVSLPQNTLKTLAEGGIGLELSIRDVRISIPVNSLAATGTDVYFRVVPDRSDTDRKSLEDRAMSELSSEDSEFEGGGKVIGRPMTIETNMQEREIDLILPLGDITLTEELLAGLGVYVEHSDGTKEWIRGEVVPFDASGAYGVRIQVTRAELAAVLARTVLSAQGASNTAETTFRDVKQTHWAFDAIEQGVTAGFLKGYPDGSFRPDQAVARAELAVIASNLVSGLAGTSPSFTDIAGHWGQASIVKAAQAGLLRGYSDGSFQPDGKLTRAELVVVMNTLLDISATPDQAPQWPDVPKKHWAFGAIQAATSKDVEQ